MRYLFPLKIYIYFSSRGPDTNSRAVRAGVLYDQLLLLAPSPGASSPPPSSPLHELPSPSLARGGAHRPCFLKGLEEEFKSHGLQMVVSLRPPDHPVTCTKITSECGRQGPLFTSDLLAVNFGGNSEAETCSTLWLPGQVVHVVPGHVVPLVIKTRPYIATYPALDLQMCRKLKI